MFSTPIASSNLQPDAHKALKCSPDIESQELRPPCYKVSLCQDKPLIIIKTNVVVPIVYL